MKHKTIKIFIIIIILLILSFLLIKYLKNNEYSTPLEEITLEIKLDLKEDIGLIIIDYEVDDISGSGGISNANKTLISYNDTLTYTLNKQEFNNLSNIENLIINFKIITKYIDPNYENIYPEEYTSIIAPIQIKAHYGETYHITITGDKTNGYIAKYE
jgi:hypothetical protein